MSERIIDNQLWCSFGHADALRSARRLLAQLVISLFLHELRGDVFTSPAIDATSEVRSRSAARSLFESSFTVKAHEMTEVNLVLVGPNLAGHALEMTFSELHDGTDKANRVVTVDPSLLSSNLASMSDERPRTPKGSKRERVKGFAKQFLGGLRGTPSSSSSLQPCSSSADRTTSGLEPPSASSGEQGLIPRPVRNDEEPSMSTLDTSSASRSPLPPVQGPEEPPYHNYGTVNNIGKVGNSFSGTNFGTFIQNSNEEPNWLDALHSRLKISAKADHRYYPGGDEQALRRSGCTPGTRIRIIEAIIAWATNASASSEIIYWLSGPGGAGKSTIAYTIAHLFESMMTRGDGATILGGSFFCSRHSAETRTASAIVRTIVYQLALRSEAFKMALKEHGRFETVD
ncbi:hypothetical protein BKA70DRAFT_1394473, partial [Coprinopsis sp. MPI-PUGE-AT-0042]